MHYKFQPYSEQAFLYLKETLEDLTRYSKFWQNWYTKYLQQPV